MGTRQRGQLLIIAVILAATMAMGANMVSAHAQLKTSTPADKATVSSSPTQIAITFSEETDPLKSGGSVTDASGATVSTGFTVDLNQRTNMTIALKTNLPNGAYTVKWNSFTDDDSGVANGTFTYTLQQAQPATTTGTAPASASAVAGTVPAATTAPAATATIAATTAPTATVASTVAPTATRVAPTPAATGTGGGTAVATSAPTTLPKTGQGSGTSGTPWAIIVLAAAIIAVAGGLTFRFRAARR